MADERTILKFADFWNLCSFPNWVNSEKLLIFLFGKFENFLIWKIQNCSIWKINEFLKFQNLKNERIFKNFKFEKIYNLENPYFTI